VKRLIAVLIAQSLLSASAACAQEMPQMPKPTRHHDWLKKLEGEWTTEGTMEMGPGKPPLKSTGRESAKMLGGFWLIGDQESEMMGQKMKALLQLGYDDRKKKYVGSWLMSADGTFWTYEGFTSRTGNALVLESTGPNVITQKGTARYRETITIDDADHRTFTSEMLDKKGKGTKMVEVKYTRVKK
jgi:hypothetical protein